MSEGVPRFVLQIDETLYFKAFHMGIAVSVPFIIKNRINLLNSWSVIEETVRYLHTYEESHRVTIIHDQLRAMRRQRVIEKYTALKILLEPSLTMLCLDLCIRE